MPIALIHLPELKAVYRIKQPFRKYTQSEGRPVGRNLIFLPYNCKKTHIKLALRFIEITLNQNP